MRLLPYLTNDYAPPKLLYGALTLSRVALGLYFLLAGWGKVMGELRHGLGSFYRGPFSSLQPNWLPDLLAAPYGYTLPWLEVLFGVTLLLGLLSRLSAAVVTLMLISFTVALAMKLVIDAQADDDSGPFKANYIMIALSLALMHAGSRLSLDAFIWNRPAS